LTSSIRPQTGLCIIPESQSAARPDKLKIRQTNSGSNRRPEIFRAYDRQLPCLQNPRYCRKIHLAGTGIGSYAAFYNWPGALTRSLVAIHPEKKHAVISVSERLLCIAALFLS
jgi:hypothetical protein